MQASSGEKLLRQAEKILLQPIHPHLISYCPTMDLIAIVTDQENLDVYRINGQRAFGLKRKSADATVDCVCWEFNGQAIAVAWSDGLTDILSAETGKVIYPNLPAPSKGPVTSRIRCMGWGLNFIDVESVKRRTGQSKQKTNGSTASVAFTAETTDDWDAFRDDTTLEDFMQRQPDLEALDVAPDLPDQLAMMDMEAVLPKLPAIPLPPATPFMRPGQADSGAFSSQAQTDSLLHSHQMKDHNSVDMFIRCTDAGTVHPSIYDSLETVSIKLPSTWPVESSRTIQHTSHPYSCSHGLLKEIKTAGGTELAFVPLSLGFISSAGTYLHLIASKTSQLQNLLLYLKHCLQRIQTYWKHSQELPSKFMRNISETLQEKGQGDLVDNLYHLACTGHCPQAIKEWLVEELQEAGHKRWDNTVASSLSIVVQLLHENFLPALDRCAIVISRLRGLAQYHDSGWIFNAPLREFTALLELLKNLRLLAHTTLQYASDEKRQFHFFSKWLRYEIDFEATEPHSQSRAEMEARDPVVDIGVVLKYIRSGLMESDLAPFLQAREQLSEAQKKAEIASHAETLKAIDLTLEAGSYKPEALSLDNILHFFKAGCSKLFQQISHWQESNTTMDCGIVLESDIQGDETVDMRMVFESNTTTRSMSPKSRTRQSLHRLNNHLSKLTLSETSHPESISTYILISPAPTTTAGASPSHIDIHKLAHTPTIDAFPKSLHTYAITSLHFPPSTIVLDAKFADDTTLLVLLRSTDTDNATTTRILFLPYTSSSASNTNATTTPSSPITYPPLPTSTYPSLTLPSGNPIPASNRNILSLSAAAIEKYTNHVFEGRFEPLKLVVNGRKGRRVIVVLGADRKHYQVLDMDFREERGKGGAVVGEESAESGEEGVDVEMD